MDTTTGLAPYEITNSLSKTKTSSSLNSLDDTPEDQSTSITSPEDHSTSITSSSSTESLLTKVNAKITEQIASRDKMIDTYGNEFKLPDYTFNDLRNAIPRHCFQRSAARGLGYVARDIVQWSTLLYVCQTFITPRYIESTLLRGALWFAYTVVAGWILTGLWVLAHECGHEAFSDSKKLNDIVGFILHSSLGVPYFAWQISHRKHHQNTGNLERDMVFVPSTRQQYATKVGKLVHEVAEMAEDTPIFTAVELILQQLFGWIMYLSTNVTGHNHHPKVAAERGAGKKNGPFGGVSHFDPSSPIFDEKDRPLIWMSDLGLIAWVTTLILVGQKIGAWNLFVYYGAPYLWVNNWLVWITYLQHTDPTLPHYDPAAWTFTRGAACTIDREFGFIGRYFMHGIVETHVVHHYFPKMPFYHGDEATEAVKPIMAQHYRADTKDGIWGFLRAIWVSHTHCQWVEPTEGAEGLAAGVQFFRNHNGLGVPPAKLAQPTEEKDAVTVG